MLTVDIAGLTDQELQRTVWAGCARFGAVVRVRVHVSRINSPSRPCAIVDMATAEEAKRVADSYAATSIGKSVVILLAPKTASEQQLISYRASFDRAMPEPRAKTMFQLLAQYESQTRTR